MRVATIPELYLDSKWRADWLLHWGWINLLTFNWREGWKMICRGLRYRRGAKLMKRKLR